MIVDSGKTILLDKKFNEDVKSQSYENYLFTRLVAKERSFTKVSFKYSIFDQVYLKKCSFDSCDFTGCKFLSSNLLGSSFSGCNFEYAQFEKTQIDNDVLDSSCPGYENLKQKFARSLRVNYQQLGEARSANKAKLGSEDLFSLSAEAIERWISVNNIKSESRLVHLVTQAAGKLFFLATKSQEQISDNYKLLSQEVNAIYDLIALEMSSFARRSGN